MSENTRENSARIRVLAVGFPHKEVEDLSRSCKSAEFLEASSAEQLQHTNPGGDKPPVDLLLLCAKDSDRDKVVNHCEKLRRHRTFSEIPLLVVISRYQMALGHDVAGLPQTTWTIHPVEPDHFIDKLKELKVA